MLRVGAPRWLAILVSVWGLLAISFSLVRTAGHFYFLRFCLGVAEAGAFPGDDSLVLQFSLTVHLLQFHVP